MKYISHIRLLLSKYLNKIILGNIVGSFPGNIIRSIDEICYKEYVASHIDKTQTIYDASTEFYEFPPEYSLSFRRQNSFDSKKIYFLKNVIVSPKSGVIWTKENYVFQESVGSLRRILSWSKTRNEIMMGYKTEKKEDQTYYCVPSKTYYHWTFEVLPNLLLALEYDHSCKVLVQNSSPTYIIETLKLIFGENFNKKVLFVNSACAVKRLVLVNFDAYSGFVRKKELEKIRTSINQIVPFQKNDTTAIYISRKFAKARKLINEREVEKIVEAMGIKVIYAENLSLIEQINLFRNLRVIIAPHGAGLSNLIWCNTEIKILEVFPFDNFNDCYARLAMARGFKYDYIFAEKYAGSFGKIPIILLKEKITDLIHAV